VGAGEVSFPASPSTRLSRTETEDFTVVVGSGFVFSSIIPVIDATAAVIDGAAAATVVVVPALPTFVTFLFPPSSSSSPPPPLPACFLLFPPMPRRDRIDELSELKMELFMLLLRSFLLLLLLLLFLLLLLLFPLLPSWPLLLLPRILVRFEEVGTAAAASGAR